MSSSLPNRPQRGRTLKAAKANRPASFTTAEERAARRHDTPISYFRLDDTLCKEFLLMAATPSEFEGLKLLFPFIREGAVLQFPRTRARFPTWIGSAFCAGFDLGNAQPELLEAVLPGRELGEALRRVGVIQKYSGDAHFTWDGLRRTCLKITQERLDGPPENPVESVLMETVVQCLRAGFAAATVAQYDPSRFEFVSEITRTIEANTEDIMSKVWIKAPRNAVGKPVVELLEHPLLRLARENYSDEPIQNKPMLEFLRAQLLLMDVRSENVCPASELDLLDWIEAGLKYGTRLKQEHPELVEKILEECGPRTLKNVRKLVQQLTTKAGGVDPARLLPQLKSWQKTFYGWDQPRFYGEELALVVCFADFAVWIPWVADPARR